MAARLFTLGIGCFIGICVLLLFFFPLVQGPFQATHGPTTAFRARNAFMILLFSIVFAAHGLLLRIKAALEVCSRTPDQHLDPLLHLTIGEAAILRC